MEAVVDPAGRIVVPKALRDALGLRARSKLDISLIASAAAEATLPLATRDARAKPTYERIGVTVVMAG